jgi:amino acid transporter
LGVIAAFTWLNVRGTRLVGAASGVFMAVLVLPFLALAVAGFWRLATDPRPIVGSFLPEGVGLGAGLAGGLGIVLWNYLGWDQLSTVAEEVEEPQRAYPMAMLVGVPLVTLVYLLPVLPSLAFFPDTSLWEDGSWPQIAQAVAGPGLALVVALAALVSPAALFTASLLGSSRIPFVLAADRFLPRSLVAVHPRFGTPHRAILVCAACYALLAWRDFTTLVTVNVVLYAAALSMEAVSLAVLRRKEPTLVRPFRVPGGRLGVGLVVALPILVLVALVSLTVAEEGWASQCWTMAALASGPIVYGLVRKSQRP